MTDIAEVRAALEECANELAEWVENHYKHNTQYPSERRRYERDMEPVKRAQEVLAALSRMEQSAAPEGRHWRHVTSGMFVTEIGRGRMQTAEPIGDMTPIVIYHHAGEHGGGTYWVRPVKEFEDGKFVEPAPPLAETEGKP